MRPIKSLIAMIFITSLFLTPTTNAIAATQDQYSTGKQIVFLMGAEDQKFTSVSISGTNQNNSYTTWTRSDANGFSIAYTKDWWWAQDFVEISFTVQDSLGIQTLQTCTFDNLSQPVNSPRVEIEYFPGQGCVGGEAGSASDPIGDSVKPVRDAFATLSQYLPEDKFDFFMTLLDNELNATGCVLGLAAIAGSRGFAVYDETIRDYVSETCQSTGDMIYEIFID